MQVGCRLPLLRLQAIGLGPHQRKLGAGIELQNLVLTCSQTSLSEGRQADEGLYRAAFQTGSVEVGFFGLTACLYDMHHVPRLVLPPLVRMQRQACTISQACPSTSIALWTRLRSPSSLSSGAVLDALLLTWSASYAC